MGIGISGDSTPKSLSTSWAGQDDDVIVGQDVHDGVVTADSNGTRFMCTPDMAGDIQTFRAVFGENSVRAECIPETDSVTITASLFLERSIPRDTALAWELDPRTNYVMSFDVSPHYRRAGKPAKIAVKALPRNEPFPLQFQLQSILEKYISATWRYDSPPFVSPVASKGDVSARPQARSEETAEKWAQLVEMGFGIVESKAALDSADGNTEVAANLILAGRDKLDLDKYDSYATEGEYFALVSHEQSPSSAAPQQGSSESYLVRIVNYLASRAGTLNEYCIICDKPHVFGNMLKPTICTRDLCSWSFQELHVAANATDFVATSHDVVGILLYLAKEAAKSSRNRIIFNPFPLIYDPHDKTKKVLDPENRNYAYANQLLSAIPPLEEIIAKSKGSSIQSTISAIGPYAYPLFSWVIQSNRSFFVKLPDELVCPSLPSLFVTLDRE